MMLRASVEAGDGELDLRGVTDSAVDSGVRGGGLLMALVDAAQSGGDTPSALAGVRAEMGDAAALDAAGVIANFEMMNRVADATGMPVGRGTLARTEEVRRIMGIDRFRHDL